MRAFPYTLFVQSYFPPSSFLSSSFPMTRCAAFTVSGRRCKHSASNNGMCFTHSDQPLVGARKCCGHRCYLATTKCCECEDLRPDDQSLYLKYIDGTGGSLPVGARADGYCPCCKPRCIKSNVTVRTAPTLVIEEPRVTPVSTPVRLPRPEFIEPPPAPRRIRYDRPEINIILPRNAELRLTFESE